MDDIERVAFNEAVFRDVNDRIGGLQSGFGRATTMDIVCECGDDTCMERIALPPEEYRHVRDDDRTFALIPGHERPDVETVVEEHDGYNIVEKHPGPGAQVVEKLA